MGWTRKDSQEWSHQNPLGRICNDKELNRCLNRLNFFCIAAPVRNFQPWCFSCRNLYMMFNTCSINPYCQNSDSGNHIHNEYFPISAVPLLATQSAEYQDTLLTVSNRANKAYRDFLLSDEGHGFNGQVWLYLLLQE